jgi:hypothetical protein
VSIVLDKIKQELNANSTKFENAFREFSSVSHLDTKDTRYQEALADLTQAMRSLESSVEDATEAQKYGGRGGGTGGQDGDEYQGRMQRYNKYAGVATAALGTALAATTAYQSTGLAFDKALYGKQAELAQTPSSLP